MATDDKSMMDSVFSGSDMGADSAAPVTSPDVPAPSADAQPPVAEPKPEDIVKADEVKDDEATLQGRDPKSGRFVPVTELVAERKKLKGEREQEAKLRIEAEANAKAWKEQVEALQRQAQQPQQRQQQPQEQQPIPDPVLDPEGYSRYQQSVMDARLLDMQVNMSERMARMQHGDAKVDAALQAAHQSGIAERFVRAADPFGALLQWHRRSMMNAEIGDDLEAFKKRVADDAVQKALAGLKATGQPPGQAQQPQRFPGTLADATPTGAQGAVLTPETAVNDVFAKQRRA